MAHDHLIAIVDDDKSVCDAATNLFRSTGLAAVAFASAEEFLNSGSLERTSCLVLDVQMPGMGGLKLQTQLAESGRRIPIVFVTGYPHASVRDRVMRSGAILFPDQASQRGRSGRRFAFGTDTRQVI